MISTESLSIKINQRLNKLDTSEHQHIPVEQKILLLREAEIKLIKRKLNINNPLRVGFDGSKKRYDDLQGLVEPHEKHPLKLKLESKKLNRWVADVSKITPSYMFYIDSYIIADKETCKDRVVWINPDLAAHADVSTLLTNSNYAPSFEYQETFCDLSNNEIGVYTDGSFTPKTLFLSYIRYPIKLDLVGYEDLQGIPSKTQDSELPEYLEDEILDIVVADIAQYTENTAAYQANTQNKLSNE